MGEGFKVRTSWMFDRRISPIGTRTYPAGQIDFHRPPVDVIKRAESLLGIAEYLYHVYKAFIKT